MPSASTSTQPENKLQPTQPPIRRSHWRRRISTFCFRLLKLVPFLALAVIIALIASLYVSFWPGEILVSFLPQAMIAMAGAGMVYATIILWIIIHRGLSRFLRRYGWWPRSAVILCTLLGTYVLFVSSHLLVPTSLSAPPVVDTGDRLKVSTFNKLFSNHNLEKDAYFLQSNMPHIMGFEEIVADEVDYVGDVMDYEYRYVSECDCSANDTELGLVSKYPIVYASTEYYQNNSAILHARVQLRDEKTVAVFVVHMGVPAASKNLAVRQDAYNYLAQQVNQETEDSFIMGDFNTTVFSPQLRGFVNDLNAQKLIYDRRWPQCSWYGFGDIGCVRIDHIIVPKTAIIHDIKVGDDGFSDHRPVVVDLTL